MLLLFVSFCSSDILGFYVGVMTNPPKARRTKSRVSVQANRGGWLLRNMAVGKQRASPGVPWED